MTETDKTTVNVSQKRGCTCCGTGCVIAALPMFALIALTWILLA